MLTLEKRKRSPKDLVELLDECHERIRSFAALARAAAASEEAPTEQIVQACADVERYFVQALPLHVADEEESIEPRLRGLSPEVDRAIDAMARQHRGHEPMLRDLLSALAKVRQQPQEQALRHELGRAARLAQSELEEHLVLEETVIFPAIRELLSQETQMRIIDELRRRRRPESD